jgi:NADPH:quinone reductase-like Zn-dependent oxidoreductase
VWDASPSLPPRSAIEKLLPLLRSGGVLASVLGVPLGARGKPIRVRAFTAQPDAALLARFAHFAAQKRFVIPIAERLPLAKVGEAQQLVEAHKVDGKIVLIP